MKLCRSLGGWCTGLSDTLSLTCHDPVKGWPSRKGQCEKSLSLLRGQPSIDQVSPTLMKAEQSVQMHSAAPAHRTAQRDTRCHRPPRGDTQRRESLEWAEVVTLSILPSGGSVGKSLGCQESEIPAESTV